MTDPIRELQCRLAAVEARLPWTGTAADVAPQVVPITTLVEPAPQAQQGVTVEELARILSEAPSGDLCPAYWLLKHPRIGPLLRGEGAPAPKRVVLPEAPPMPRHFRSGQPGAFQRDGYCEAWAAARAEVERQQGGQAAPEPDAEPEPNQAPAGDHIRAATQMAPAGDGGLLRQVRIAIGGDHWMIWEVESRAAILAVAKWLRSVGNDGSAADLEREAQR